MPIGATTTTFENKKNGTYKAGKKVSLAKTKRKAANRASAKRSKIKAC